MGYIYKIVNTINQKSYIGQTTRKIERRIKEHFGKSPNVFNSLIKKAIDKHGANAFIVEILHEGVFDFMLDDLEAQEIKNHNTLVPNGYNLESGGKSNQKASKETRLKISEARKRQKRSSPSEETRQKISAATKGRVFPPEHCRRISEAKKNKPTWNKGKTGKKCSIETRRKISAGNKGKKRSEEAKRKMSEAAKRRGISPEHRQKIAESQKHAVWQHADEIRKMYATGEWSHRKLAKHFGCSKCPIQNILNP